MYRKKEKKEKTLYDHTKRRLEERYGIKYTQLLRDTLLSQIRNGKAKLIKRQSLRVSVWDGLYEIRENDIINNLAKPGIVSVRFVYDRNRKTIITVLLPDMNPDDLEFDELL